MLDVPAVAEVAGGDLFAESQVGVAFDGDLVVKIQVDQVAQSQMAGEGSRFGRNSFHQVAVGTETVNPVIEQLRADALLQEAGAHRHADANRDSLAEWSGGGFDAGGVAELRVAYSRAVDLTEVFQVIQG